MIEDGETNSIYIQESFIFYYHDGHLGSMRLETDSSKIIVSAATYHPFGETSAEERSESYPYTRQKKMHLWWISGDWSGKYYNTLRYTITQKRN